MHVIHEHLFTQDPVSRLLVYNLMYCQQIPAELHDLQSLLHDQAICDIVLALLCSEYKL